YPRARSPVGPHRARQGGQPRRAGGRIEGARERMEGLPDVGLGDAVEAVARLFVQHEVAIDERFQGAPEAAFHPSRTPSNPADLAVLQREEGGDPVGVTPLAAL